MKVKSESEVVQLCPTLATPWTAAYQAPTSMGFSRQQYWSGVPLPSPLLCVVVLNAGWGGVKRVRQFCPQETFICIYRHFWLSPFWVMLLEKEMAPHSSTIAWKIPWTEESGRLQSMGSQRVGHD